MRGHVALPMSSISSAAVSEAITGNDRVVPAMTTGEALVPIILALIGFFLAFKAIDAAVRGAAQLTPRSQHRLRRIGPPSRKSNGFRPLGRDTSPTAPCRICGKKKDGHRHD